MVFINCLLRLFFTLADFFCDFCFFYHPLGKAAVAFGGVVDEDMGDGADKITVLNDGTAAHALDDAAGFFQQVWVGDFYNQSFAAGFLLQHYFFDFYRKGFHFVTF